MNATQYLKKYPVPITITYITFTNHWHTIYYVTDITRNYWTLWYDIHVQKIMPYGERSTTCIIVYYVTDVIRTFYT